VIGARLTAPLRIVLVDGGDDALVQVAMLRIVPTVAMHGASEPAGRGDGAA
jgi:hypothetical protein